MDAVILFWGETDISEILGVRANVGGKGGELQIGGIYIFPFLSLYGQRKKVGFLMSHNTFLTNQNGIDWSWELYLLGLLWLFLV